MKREIEDRTILEKFAIDFCNIINKYVIYVVCSGFVAITHGRTRGTEDVDMIIEKISKKRFEELHNALKNGGFECIQSDNPEVLFQYLDKRTSLRYVRSEQNFFPPEMEIKFPKDELDEQQLKTRKKLPLTGLDIYFSSIEDNIAFKEEFLKNEKDLEDAQHLRIIYEGQIDEDKINRIKEKIKKLR